MRDAGGHHQSELIECASVEGALDRLATLARTLCGASHAMVSVVDGDRVLFRSNLGLCVRELDRRLSLTDILVGMGPDAVLVAEATAEHPILKDHPLVVGEPYLGFFAGATVSNAAGEPIGAVGVMNREPMTGFGERERESLKHLAGLAGELLDRAEDMRSQAERLELLRLGEDMAGVGQWRLEAMSGKVSWSDAVYRIHGVDRATFDPDYDDAVSVYHPDDRAILEAAIARGLETGEGYQLRLRMTRADGEERRVLSHARAERDENGRVIALAGVFQDVTEQEAAYREASRNARRYQLLADNTGDVIARVGLDGRSRYISPAIEGLLGWRYEEMSGQAMDYVHGDDRSSVLEAIRQAIRSGGQTRLEHRALHRDGRVLWVECSFKAIGGGEGSDPEVVTVIRDIGARKALEAELTEARDRAESAARAKSEFLANMSHELRTPLTSVIGFAGLLKDARGLEEDERRYVDRIADGSEALLSVINDILDYSKIEAGAAGLVHEIFDPRAMLEGAAGLVESQCRARALMLRVDVAEDMPRGLVGDAGRLRQVVLNFLSNAVKFTRFGTVRLSATYGGGRLRVAVQDTGIGIAEDKLADLFERFVQADASTTRNFGGTGLGLAISRRLVEMMGGEVGVESRSGVGSTFRFEVPLETGDSQGVIAADAAPDIGTNLRILVADDTPANRELVAALLMAMGLNPDMVENGAEAVEAVRNGSYDLVLMDMHMPEMDGLSATRAIRLLPGDCGRVPIIALTANVQPEQVWQCRDAGMDGHVGKPIQPQELVSAMGEALARRGDDVVGTVAG